MWKSDNDSEDRTAASIPLQQSCFIQYREAEEFRQEVRRDPEASAAEVRQIVRALKAALKDAEEALRELCDCCAENANAYAKEIRTFANGLQVGLFAGEDGEEDLLRFARTLSRARPYELSLREGIACMTGILRDLSELRLPAKRAEVICRMMEQTDGTKALLKKVSQATGSAKDLYQRLLTFRDLLLPFVQKTLPAFLKRSKELTDLEGNGAHARPGGLRSLCGEVCYAAEEFARACGNV